MTYQAISSLYERYRVFACTQTMMDDVTGALLLLNITQTMMDDVTGALLLLNIIYGLLLGECMNEYSMTRYITSHTKYTYIRHNVSKKCI